LKSFSRLLPQETRLIRLVSVFLPKREKMSVFLFDEMIFGPVKSRRLGVSLGINLLPTHRKMCSFNCIYCECGWTTNKSIQSRQLPSLADFELALENKLIALQGTELEPDSLTFAGNGEPCIHPQFAQIVDSTLALREKFAPKANVSVLTNGSMLHKEEVFEALLRVDNSLLKLDGGTAATISAINMPLKAFKLEVYVEQLKRFNGNFVIQSLFLRGQHKGVAIDNTTQEEVNAWLNILLQVKPKKVMVYAIERDTPASGLVKVSETELESIAAKVRRLGIEAEVFA
jgi:wyosine [tRNA(Phe)-imidazoG37] synthetase (radical SAM superfamily)